MSTSSKHDDAIEAFRLTYIEPLFDYIDEQIDDKRMKLTLLKKYKHRCEWFRREPLLSLLNEETQKGEKTLAADLYEYLHEQGLDFHIEPESASGRIDLISSQTGNDRLVADVKLFNPSRGQNKTYIAKGFRQVYEYTRDFNELFGYLIIFKTSEDEISIAAPQQESSIAFITHNNKTIFFLIIDIWSYEQSASKRGVMKSYELTRDELVTALEEPSQPPFSDPTSATG